MVISIISVFLFAFATIFIMGCGIMAILLFKIHVISCTTLSPVNSPNTSSSKMLQTGTLHRFLQKQPGACLNLRGLQFAIPLFLHYSNKNMMSSVENFLNLSYVRFAYTTTTATAHTSVI